MLFNGGVITPTNFQRGRPFQSKLEPVAQVIRDLRRHRKSYREIAEILRDEHGVAVDRTTIWSFVKVRANPRRAIAMADDLTPVALRTETRVFNAIAVLKAKPAPAVKRPLFIYDENQPLTLKTEK